MALRNGIGSIVAISGMAGPGHSFWAATIPGRRQFLAEDKKSRYSALSKSIRAKAASELYEIQKSRFQIFFARNALIFLVSPKKKFGKISKAKCSALENKGKFLALNCRTLQKPRPPAVPEGSRSAGGEGLPHSHSIGVPGGLLVTS